MKITLTHQLLLESNQTVVTATLTSPKEAILLLSSGQVVQYNIKEQQKIVFFSIEDKEGDFDLKAPSSIYVLDTTVVVVNNYKEYGWVYHPKHTTPWLLKRGSYHLAFCPYPIALFKDEAAIPHLIYAEDWNHLQIMNLDSKQILTADKSLYEENSMLATPRTYDYFFGQLHLSPNRKYILSAGWVWGSHDCYIIYEIEHFIKEDKILGRTIDGWEHEARAVCWVDDHTIALTYDPQEEEDEMTKATHQEIHLYKVEEANIVLYKKIPVLNLDIVSTHLHYHQVLNAFILFSDNIGLIVLSLEGKILLQDSTKKLYTYFPTFNSFLKIEGSSIALYTLNH